MKKTFIKSISLLLVFMLVVPMLFSCSVFESIFGKKSIVKKSMTEEEKAEVLIEAQNTASASELYVDSKSESLMTMTFINGTTENSTKIKTNLLTLCPKDDKTNFKYREISTIKEDGEDEYKPYMTEILSDGKLYIKEDDKAFCSDMTAENYINYHYNNTENLSIDNFGSVSCEYNEEKELYTVKLSNPVDDYKYEIKDLLRNSLREITHFVTVSKYDLVLVVTPLGEPVSSEEKIVLDGVAGSSYEGMKVKFDYEQKALDIGEDEKIDIPEDSADYKAISDALIIKKINKVYNDALNIKVGQVDTELGFTISSPYNYTFKLTNDYDFKIMKNGNVQYSEYYLENSENVIEYDAEFKDGQIKVKDTNETIDYSQEDAYLDIFNSLNLCAIDTTEFTDYQVVNNEYICTIDTGLVEEYMESTVASMGVTVTKITVEKNEVHFYLDNNGRLIKIQKTMNAKINNSFTVTDSIIIEITPISSNYYDDYNI